MSAATCEEMLRNAQLCEILKSREPGADRADRADADADRSWMIADSC